MADISNALAPGIELKPAEPLYRRVPTRDETGQYLSDFMMIIPGLKKQPQAMRREVIAKIGHVLELYKSVVMFADLNMNLNVLWVSVKPLPGICIELPAVIKLHVPAALLVSHRLHN